VVVVCSYAIITHLQNKKLKIDVYRDALTGCYNRRYLQNLLENIENRFFHHSASQKGVTNYALIFFDLDHFKEVNDKYGHDAGDIVLQHFTKIISSQCRVGDVFARWGGEEFVVLCRIDETKTITEICQRFQQKVFLAKAKVSKTVELDYTCSIGAVSYPIDQKLINKSTAQAANLLSDFALYQAKENGRNTWCVIEASANLTGTDLNELNNNKIINLVKEEKLNLILPSKVKS